MREQGVGLGRFPSMQGRGAGRIAREDGAGMKQTEEITRMVECLRRELPFLSVRYGVDSLALFGSRARGESRPGSDLDVIAEFRTTPGLLRLLEVEHHLGDLLGLRVDLVLTDSLKPGVAARVKGDLVPV